MKLERKNNNLYLDADILANELIENKDFKRIFSNENVEITLLTLLKEIQRLQSENNIITRNQLIIEILVIATFILTMLQMIL